MVWDARRWSSWQLCIVFERCGYLRARHVTGVGIDVEVKRVLTVDDWQEGARSRAVHEAILTQIHSQLHQRFRDIPQSAQGI